MCDNGFTFCTRDEITDETIKGGGLEFEAIDEPDLMLDFDCFSLLVFIRTYFNFFAEANVILLIIRNASDLAFALAEILDEQMRVIVGQIMKNHRSELWLLELQVAYFMRGSSILSREMVVVSDFVTQTFTSANPTFFYSVELKHIFMS